jgi:molybdopterin converting factor subunit 1
MRVRSLFFAAYRDVMGAEELEFELPEGATVAELAGLVRERADNPAMPETPVVAVNREYAAPDRELHEGDEVAFIPPVAGG